MAAYVWTDRTEDVKQSKHPLKKTKWLNKLWQIHKVDYSATGKQGDKILWLYGRSPNWGKKARYEQKVQHIAIFVRAYISYMIMYWFVFM